MQLEVGSIIDGKITGITNFGAFVALPEGKTGMVHISEVSNSYVKDINEHLEENAEVKVKVLSIANDGKIGLSIKACQEQPCPPEGSSEARSARPAPNQQRRENSYRNDDRDRKMGGGERRPPNKNHSKGVVWQPKQEAKGDGSSFEDLITKFKQVSNDRMSDLKKSSDTRRPRRGGGGNGSNNNDD